MVSVQHRPSDLRNFYPLVPGCAFTAQLLCGQVCAYGQNSTPMIASAAQTDIALASQQHSELIDVEIC